MDPATLSALLPALLGGGGKTQVSQSSNVNVSSVSSPVVAVSTGAGGASPSQGTTASPGITSSQSPDQPTTLYPSIPGVGSFFGTSPVAQGYDAGTVPSYAASPVTGEGLFSDPKMLLLIGGAAALFFLMGKKGKK